MPNALDLAIFIALVIAFAGGWQLGFVTRATSWLGLATGLVIGARIMPLIVDRLDGASSARLFFTMGMVFIALGSIGLLIGLIIGNWLRHAVSGMEVHPVDRFAGGLTSCAGVLFVVWLLIPVMADVPQWPAQQARGSRIAQVIDTVMPEAPDSIHALSRMVGEDRFPRVLDALQPTPRLVAPPAETGLTQAVATVVAQSVVRVEGVACRRIQVGSGFVIDGDLVVTNAHVIAGEPSTIVQRDDGVQFDATVVLFDPGRDLAVLAVAGIDRPPLQFRTGQVGDTGGVFGHPGGGELRIAPFEVARHLRATGRDIYHERRISRDVYFIASELEGGDSGAAIVAPDGAVIGVAFAVAPDRDGVAYALTADEVLSALDSDLGPQVDTGACLR